MSDSVFSKNELNRISTAVKQGRLTKQNEMDMWNCYMCAMAAGKHGNRALYPVRTFVGALRSMGLPESYSSKVYNYFLNGNPHSYFCHITGGGETKNSSWQFDFFVINANEKTFVEWKKAINKHLEGTEDLVTYSKYLTEAQASSYERVKSVIEGYKLLEMSQAEVAKANNYTTGAVQMILRIYGLVRKCEFQQLQTELMPLDEAATQFRGIIDSCAKIAQVQVPKDFFRPMLQTTKNAKQEQQKEEGNAPLWAQRLLQDTATLIDKIEDEIVVNQKCAEIITQKLDEIIKLLK